MYGSSDVQNKNPFVDEYALRDSGYDQDVISTMQGDAKTTMIDRSLSLPVSDDGLPDSVPSRHTLSASSSGSISRHVHAAPLSAGSRHRPPPLPLSPRSITSLQTLSNPLQVFISGHGADLVTPRASPQRQTTFVDAAVGDSSETASIHSAGGPIRASRESQRAAVAPKKVSVKPPSAYTARTRSSVSGQTQPFPLLSPALAEANGRRALDEKEDQNHEKSNHGSHMLKQRTHRPTDTWRLKSNWIDLSLKAVFVIGVITLTAAVVAGVKDAKFNVLEASTVIAGIIGFVGSAASILCAWAISIGRRCHKGVNLLSVPNEKQDRVSPYSKEMRPKMEHLSVASGKGRRKTEDVERSPRFEQQNPINYLAFSLQGQHPSNSAQANKFGSNLSIPQTAHSSSVGTPLPSFDALPVPSSRRHSAPSSQSEADKSYREILELRLASRDIWEVLDEAANVDEVYGSQPNLDGVPHNESQRYIAHGISEKSVQNRQTESQTLRTRNNGFSKQQSVTSTATRSPSSLPSVFLRAKVSSPHQHTLSLFGKSEPFFSSYPPLSLTSSSKPSIDQTSPTSLAHPSPVYQQSSERTSATSVAYSDTSSLRELKTMRSVEKVRLWQKFMLDGVEHLWEVKGWERGQGSG
ncbi:MAG: hypothetical protein Q9195_008009 [Heterodermia aff. obscurata]